MGRYGRRISRSLIGILIVTLILGLAFYLKNTKTTHAEEAASLMSGARELVDGANVALGGMVDSMSAIQQATTGISKIIKTID